MRKNRNFLDARLRHRTPSFMPQKPNVHLTAGFTLIEVLIVMTLLSVMVVLLFASMKICADSWEKGERKIASVNEVAVVYNFFQRHLSSAKPLWDDFTRPEERAFSFQGDTNALQFVAEFPASAGRAGLQLFSLQLQRDDQQQYIEVTITPFFPVAEGETLPTEKVTLVKRVNEFSVMYFGSEDGTSGGVWQALWQDRENLPQLVKITVELEGGLFWPDMIIPLKNVGMPDSTDFAQDADDDDDDDDEPDPDENIEEEVVDEEF